jgi:endoglucanase
MIGSSSPLQFQRGSRHGRWNIAISLVLALALVMIGCAQFPGSPSAPTRTNALRIEGTHFVDGRGETVFLKGASRNSLEYSCEGDRHFAVSDFQAMRSWGMNVVRIPLTLAFWLNLDGTCPEYQQMVARAVANAEAAGMFVILDLHSVTPFPQDNEIRPHDSAYPIYPMPPDTALLFWRQVAAAYANDERVLFELYNEPHDVSWNTWRDGGTVTLPNGTRYHTPGMQAFASIVNAAAPQRIIIVGGLDWSYDLSGVLRGYAISGHNIVYNTHPYLLRGPQPDIPSDQPPGMIRLPTDWYHAFGGVAERYPVITTEFGQDDGGSWYNEEVMRYFTELQTGYVAWAWHPGNHHWGALLANYDGAPSPYGAPIRAYMQKAS